MYAIAFDLEIAVLKTEYGDPYNNAYFEIRKELANLDFDWTQGSVYLHTGEGGLAAVYRAINKLRTFLGSRNRFETFAPSRWKTGRTLRPS